MTITAVTPEDEARQIKDRTLAMEVAHHVGVLGGTFRDAESANIRLLDRMEARHRDAKQAPIVAPDVRSPEERAERAAVRGVTVRTAPTIIEPNAWACKRCGVCRLCRCGMRIQAICHKATAGDEDMRKLAWAVFQLTSAASARTGRFAGMRSRDIDRLLSVAAENIADRTIRQMGEWR